MKLPSREMVNYLREQFPQGTRVELVKMDDFQAPPVGTKGTVRWVDDMAGIHINWDNGSSLAVIWGEDICRKI